MTLVFHRMLTFVGHIDTVYDTQVAKEHRLRVESGHITGPATHDMLACNLVFFYTIEAMPCRLILACAEEIGHERSDIRVLKGLARDPRSNCIVDIEGQDPHPQHLFKPLGSIASSRKAGAGYVVTAAYTTAAEKPGGKAFQLTFHGRPAHSGLEPQKGRNAVVAALYIAKALCGERKGIQLCDISGTGGARNIVPFSATLSLLAEASTIGGLEDTINGYLRTCPVPDVTCEVTEVADSPIVSLHAAILAMAAYVEALVQQKPPEGYTNSPGEIKVVETSVILQHDRRVSSVEVHQQSDEQITSLIKELMDAHPTVTLDVQWDAPGKPPLPSDASKELIPRIQRLARLISERDIQAAHRGGSADSAVLYDAAIQPSTILQETASAVLWITHLPLPRLWSMKLTRLAGLLSHAAVRTVSAAGGLGPVGGGDHQINQEYILMDSVAPTATLLAGLILSNSAQKEEEMLVPFFRWLAYLPEAGWLYMLSQFSYMMEAKRMLRDYVSSKKELLYKLL